MILAVNIGNTNIRAALGQPGIIKQIAFSADEESVDKGSAIEMIEKSFGPIWDKLSECVMASVVPALAEEISIDLERKTNKPVRRIDIRNCGDLRTDLYEGLLGEDRVVCCAHALQKFEPPFIVIDYGTATTINVVNEKGEFIGGAILTGLLTGLIALTKNTAQLPQIDYKRKDVPLIGTNTTENLLSGAVIGLACATEGFLSRIDKGNKMQVIVTGGHAPIILPHCNFKYIHEPSLLLEGLLSL